MFSTYADQELLLHIRAGEGRAFDELFNRYFATSYSQALALLKNEPEAEEIVHDVMLEIWKGRTDLSIGNLGAYLRVAVRRRALSHINANKKSAFFDVFDSALVSPYDAENTILNKDLVGLISAWAEALPEKRKQVFVRHFFDQLSAKEIAAELGISEKTVYAQINLALQDMREKYAYLLPVFYYLFVRVTEK